MCIKPIHVWKPEYRNLDDSEFKELTGYNRKDLSPEFLLNFKMSVPCGHCEDCANRKQHDIFFRAYYEYERCTELQGYCLFCTFTFSDEHIPHHGDTNHFDKRIVQNYLHALNMFTRRRYGLLVRYVWVSELGGLTHRPHHHALLYFYKFNDCNEIVLNSCRTTTTLCDLLDVVKDSWKLGISDIKETQAGGVNYVCKYVGKDVCNSDPLEKYVLSLRSEGFKKYANRYWRLKSFRRTLNQWFHRFGCFTLLSQGIGVHYERQLSRKRLIEKPIGHVTGYPYALPRYYFDRSNRRDLKENECKKLCEIPLSCRLSTQKAMFHDEHFDADLRRTYNSLPADLQLSVDDTLEGFNDGTTRAPWTEDVINEAKRIESCRKSIGRIKAKKQNEKKKIEQKASLVQRGGYKLLNVYKSFESLRTRKR